MKRVGQAVIVTCTIVAALVMTSFYKAQIISLNTSTEQQAKAQISHIKASIEREFRNIDSDILGALHLLETSSYPYRNLEDIVIFSQEDNNLIKSIEHLKTSTSMHDLMVIQREGERQIHSLVTGSAGITDPVHIQKHYEWLKKNNIHNGTGKRSVILSSALDRKVHHIYYSVLITKKINGIHPVMMTAMIGIEPFQQSLPSGYYLSLDDVEYTATGSYIAPEPHNSHHMIDYAERFDVVGDHEVWGQWRIGFSGESDRFYISSFSAASDNYKIEMAMIIIMALLALGALEYGFWSKKATLNSNKKLRESLNQCEIEFSSAQENSREISHDLFESELKFHRIIDLSEDGIIICDDHGDIKNTNQAIKNLLGYNESDLIGKHIDLIFPEYFNPIIRAPSSLGHDENNSSSKVITLKNAISIDHRFLEVELTATHIKVGRRKIWSIIVRDISEHTKNENELHGVQENLKDVIDNVAEGIITSDESGIILSFNPAAETIFGWSGEEIIGRNVSELMTDEDKSQHGEHLIQYRSSNKRKVIGTGSREVIGVRKNGENFHMEITASEMCSDSERRFIAIVRDVSERKMLEKNMYTSYSELESMVDSHTEDLKKINTELVKARDEALVAARSKAEFLAMMSHEIRTPINGVLGMLSLVRGTSLDDEQHDYIESAYASSEILLSLLNDVLDLSKIDAGRMFLDCEDFDLNQIIKKAIHINTSMVHNRDVEIACFISSTIPNFIHGDGGRLRQVLSNLISNAVKFTHKGGVMISVSLQNFIDEQYTLKFDVEDTGIGVDEVDAEKIFEEFSQADNSERRNYGGTGLGLSICKHFVSMMGGEISMTSELGKGSCFTFTAMFEKSEKQEPAGKLHTCKPFILSEHKIVSETLVKQLEEWGSVAQVINSKDILEEPSVIHGSGNEVLIIDLDPSQHTDFSSYVIKMMAALGKLKVPTLFIETDGVSIKSLIPSVLVNKIRLLHRPLLPADLLPEINAMLGGSRDKCSDEHKVLKHNDESDKQLIGLSILVAEDNIVNQKVITAMLKKLGMHVDVANNGKEAIAALSQKDHGYKLVLMDCQMPEVDGYAATRKIRMLEKNEVHGGRMPIIAMTAHALPGDREKCLDAGMDDYITKPINIEVVRKTIASFV